ncbi:hypothetical protein [Aeromonas hydrophila]|uniref:hypothetical protein n=1 Tax=Aeromonas hydrophila TaxID=644 RepID=UPI0020B1C3BC|nr:hypothetical protein [Aeromonas hydrophila]CAD7530986.1 hypothetical protein KBAHV42_20670 [Aeromonas hydrophila]
MVAEENNAANLVASDASEKIEIEFYDPKTGDSLGSEINLEADYLYVSDIENIPDYSISNSEGDIGGELKKVFRKSENKGYYREYVEYVVKKSMFKGIGFSLKNNGIIGTRDIFIDMDIIVDGDVNQITIKDQLKLNAPTKDRDNIFSISINDLGLSPNENLQIDGSEKNWKANFEIRALQPKRNVKSRQQIFIGAQSSCSVIISAKIFADILPEPLVQRLVIHLAVNSITVTSEEILKEVGFTTPLSSKDNAFLQ